MADATPQPSWWHQLRSWWQRTVETSQRRPTRDTATERPTSWLSPNFRTHWLFWRSQERPISVAPDLGRREGSDASAAPTTPPRAGASSGTSPSSHRYAVYLAQPASGTDIELAPVPPPARARRRLDFGDGSDTATFEPSVDLAYLAGDAVESAAVSPSASPAKSTRSLLGGAAWTDAVQVAVHGMAIEPPDAADGDAAEPPQTAEPDWADSAEVRLGYVAHLSRAPFSLIVFFLLYFLFQLADLSADLVATSDRAKRLVRHTCARAENATSAIASFPHAAAVLMNRQIAALANGLILRTFAVADDVADLLLDVLRKLIVQRLMVFTCVGDLFVASLNQAIGWFASTMSFRLLQLRIAQEDAVDRLQTLLSSSQAAINSFLASYNGVAQTVSSALPFVNLPQLAVQLPKVAIPSAATITIPDVDPAPTVELPSAAVNATAERLLADISLVAALRQVAAAAEMLLRQPEQLPVPAPVAVQFCSSWNFAPWDAAVAALQLSLAIAMAVVAIAAAGVVVGSGSSAWLGAWWDRYWRGGGGIHGSGRMPPTKDDAATVTDGSTKRRRRRRCCDRTPWRAFVVYVSYKPAWICCLCGLFGIVVLHALIAATAAVQAEYRRTVEPAIEVFVADSVQHVNIALANATDSYVHSLNAALAEWQSTVNSGLDDLRATLAAAELEQDALLGRLNADMEAIASNATVVRPGNSDWMGPMVATQRCLAPQLKLPLPSLTALAPPYLAFPKVSADVLRVDATPWIAGALAVSDISVDVLDAYMARLRNAAVFYYVMAACSGGGILVFAAAYALFVWARRRRLRASM